MSRGPDLSLAKTSEAIEDGINITNPKRIPGATAVVTFEVTVN